MKFRYTALLSFPAERSSDSLQLNFFVKQHCAAPPLSPPGLNKPRKKEKKMHAIALSQSRTSLSRRIYASISTKTYSRRNARIPARTSFGSQSHTLPVASVTPSLLQVRGYANGYGPPGGGRGPFPPGGIHRMDMGGA